MASQSWGSVKKNAPGNTPLVKRSRAARRLMPRASVLGVAILLAGISFGGRPAYAAGAATVTFSLNFPGSDPDRYSISVTSDGRAHYECSAKISPDSDDRENYQSDFDFSDAGRARVFQLAAQAHFFSDKIDTTRHKKLAFTGKKTLTYKDDQRDFSADYNFSSLAPVEELTNLFQNVATTLEFGRHLVHLHRYQKLALDDELTRMEDQARGGELSELQAVGPILQAIFDDPAVMNVARARAQRILEMGKLTTAAH